MASYVYTGGKYHMMAGQKIVKDSELLNMKETDKIIVNGSEYPLGNATIDVDEPTIPDVPDIPDAPEPALTTLVHEQGDEPTGGTVWHITPDGAGAMDGTSWDNAASQSMVYAIILSASSGDRVYFMEGSYTELTRPIGLPAGISLYGGFSSADTSWGARDAFEYQTVFSTRFYGTFAEITESVEGQVIDGFALTGFIDETEDGANLTYRNMTINGGEFKTLGNIYNCQFVDCVLTANDAEKVIVSTTEAKNMTLTGSLTNVTVSLNGGTLTCNGVPNSYIVEGNITATGTVSESVIINTDAVTNVTGDVNNSTVYGKVTATGSADTCGIYGEASFEGSITDCTITGGTTAGGSITDCTVNGSVTVTQNLATSTVYGNATVTGNITECDIYGDVTCQRNITGKADRNIITGDVVCKNSITNYVCEGSVKAGTVENCVLNGVCYTPKGINSVCTNNTIPVVDAMWKQDNSVRCGYYIQHRFLYYKNGWLASNECGWTAISGYPTSAYYYAYGICNGNLYALQETTVTLISTGGSGWTAISGYSYPDPYYAYGICNGNLYQLSKTTATLIETGGSGWTAISGYSYADSYYPDESRYAYGICNGNLYALQGTTVTLISTGGSGWTAINGYSYPDDSRYAYGICNGNLYALQETTVTLISTGGSGWTAISGYSTTTHDYAYGICNGNLYALQGTTATLIETGGSGWTAINGCSYSSASASHYAYGICNGNLYKLYGTEAILLGAYDGGVLLSANNCSFLNYTQSVGTATNCEFINCENESLVDSSAKFCTFTNCKGSVPSGTYNIFWNCSGTIPSANNTQSTYYADDLVAGGLGTDNTIARFTNTGFYPAQGMQDVGQPPSPITDPTGYQNWIEQFGNFQPASNSFLKGKAPLDSNVPTDIDGTTRLDPTTPGAYETAAAEE